MGINVTIVEFVDGAVGSQGRVVVATLELTLENIKIALEVDLLLDNVDESGLDVTVKFSHPPNGQALEDECGNSTSQLPEYCAGSAASQIC